MALLQLSEPGQTPDPHQRRIAIGIDLGTTHSLVASVRNGTSECLPDAQGRVLLPSVVRYLEGGRTQIGFDALAAQVQDPCNTISSAKRLMGRGIADIANRAQMPYRFIDKPGMVTLQTVAGEKSPVEVSAEILASLRQRAEDSFDDDIYGAVITVQAPRGARPLSSPMNTRTPGALVQRSSSARISRLRENASNNSRS